MRKIYTVLIAVIFLMSCSTVPITNRSQLSLISDSEMNAMSLQSYNEILNQSVVIKTGVQAEMVGKVGQKIAKAAEDFLIESGLSSELKNYSWEFNLIKEDNTVNAFCMPGGKIVVYTGILPVTKDEAGLAVVIGHEVAHAIAKHGAERVSQSLLVQYGGSLVTIFTAKKSAEMQSIIMTAYGVGTQVGVTLPFSRKHELEADRIGLILMASSGYDPNRAISFWQDMSAGKSGLTWEILSTHPSDSTRISEIKSLIPEAMKYYKK